MTYTSTKISQIIEAFEKWYITDLHSEIEDYYSSILTFENISKLSQQEFEDFFLVFAKEGGKIQSGGVRTSNRFIKNVHENFLVFKQRILAPFNSNFDLHEWLRWAESFNFFGKGLATIYLNRVDKNKYVIVNNKSIEAYTKLGYNIAKNSLDRTYQDLLFAQSDLIKKFPVLRNFFKADYLAHFLIGTNQGLALLESNEFNNDKIRKINKEDIEEAIAKIKNNPILRKGRESLEYDLVYEKTAYPPILVLSEANKIAGGQELLLSDFGNSTKNAFSILYSLGFTVEKKRLDFAEYLIKFIIQSEKGTLTTSGYIDWYKELKVKVSFGQGNPARITWIAFLDEKNTVQNGIYPVYLYFKRLKKLILAYGVSETNIPTTRWNVDDLKSISDYFAENQLGQPERYGNSFIYKIYNTDNPIIPEDINSDLDFLLEFYKGEPINLPEDEPIKPIEFNYKSFIEITEVANLMLDKSIILRFISALLTKPFVILTGLSGSGKTKLAQAFSKWICASNKQICLVPVGADWTNREPLLGFPSALEKGRYILPENGVLSLMLEASKLENQNKPYILILDEMNLSHVERYFADFLSAMESKEDIPLHPATEEWDENIGVPPNISFPQNLFIIGTVNIDETTYMFSPKVLDRASVIEFSVSENEMIKYLNNTGYLELDKIKGLSSSMASSFLKISLNKEISLQKKDEIAKSLLKFFSELKKIGAEFGYRSASEILRFATIINKIEATWGTQEIIDASVMQKLLPKVHGSRRKLEPVLKTLAILCLDADVTNKLDFKIESLLNSDELNMDIENILYPISFEKIKRMYKKLIDNGFTSYAEA